MVTAEMVTNGKPDPECYRLGVGKLGLANELAGRVLVLEDAPAGIRAGKAAGCKVLAVATTHAVEELREAGADWIVEDLRSVGVGGVTRGGRGVEVEIRGAFVGRERGYLEIERVGVWIAFVCAMVIALGCFSGHGYIEGMLVFGEKILGWGRW